MLEYLITLHKSLVCHLSSLHYLIPIALLHHVLLKIWFEMCSDPQEGGFVSALEWARMSSWINQRWIKDSCWFTMLNEWYIYMINLRYSLGDAILIYVHYSEKWIGTILKKPKTCITLSVGTKFTWFVFIHSFGEFVSESLISCFCLLFVLGQKWSHYSTHWLHYILLLILDTPLMLTHNIFEVTQELLERDALVEALWMCKHYSTYGPTFQKLPSHC